MPSARRTVLLSAFDTSCLFSYFRFRFCDLCCSRWLLNADARTSLPFLVTRIRLAMPFWVLSLGTGRLLRSALRRALRRRLGCALSRGGLARAAPAWRQDHEQVLALEQGLALDDREVLGVVRHALQDLAPYLLVDHLAAPEHDRHLYFFSSFEELTQTFE